MNLYTPMTSKSYDTHLCELCIVTITLNQCVLCLCGYQQRRDINPHPLRIGSEVTSNSCGIIEEQL